MSDTTSMFICPRCNVRVVRQPHSGDLVHSCNSGNPTLDQEDVVIIGDWIDYSGSDEGVSPSVLKALGPAVKNFGQSSWVRGAKDYSRTRRGVRATTHRQRQHLKYFNFGG